MTDVFRLQPLSTFSFISFITLLVDLFYVYEQRNGSHADTQVTMNKGQGTQMRLFTTTSRMVSSSRW